MTGGGEGEDVRIIELTQHSQSSEATIFAPDPSHFFPLLLKNPGDTLRRVCSKLHFPRRAHMVTLVGKVMLHRSTLQMELFCREQQPHVGSTASKFPNVQPNPLYVAPNNKSHSFEEERLYKQKPPETNCAQRSSEQFSNDPMGASVKGINGRGVGRIVGGTTGDSVCCSVGAGVGSGVRGPHTPVKTVQEELVIMIPPVFPHCSRVNRDEQLALLDSAKEQQSATAGPVLQSSTVVGSVQSDPSPAY
jgi:hypothetical protein